MVSMLAPGATRLALAAGLFGLLACTTTHTERPVGWEQGRVATRTEVQRIWEVRVEGGTAGFVVEFGPPGGGAEPRERYYSVRNRWHQELGTVDGLGRAWRWEPHEREARWIGTGTVLEGARGILRTGPDGHLNPAWAPEPPPGAD